MTDLNSVEGIEAALTEAPVRKARKVDQAALNEDMRKRAARQAAKEAAKLAAPEIVKARVLPMGDGKISMGQHIAGIGEVHYERGEVFEVERQIAEALEARGYVEIQDAK